MKAIIKYLCFLVLLFLNFSLSALDLNTSISWQPINRMRNVMFYNDHYDITYDYGQYLVYQADLKNRAGFSLGFGINYNSGYDANDNIVGYFSDILGYLGYNQYFIRVGTGRTPGSMTDKRNMEYPFIGPEGAKFTSEILNVELLRYSEGFGMYFGIYYRYLSLPGTSMLDENSNILRSYSLYQARPYTLGTTVPIQIIDLYAEAYGILFGIGTLTMIARGDHVIKEKNALFPWVEGWYSAGVGPSWSSINKKKTIGYIEYFLDTTGGVLFITGSDKNKFILGLGYNLRVTALFLTHGPVLNGSIVYFGNK